MAKVANPVRGYLGCPVCQSVATVHQVGEGKLIELGEPPKNNRNLGLLYYKCPKCGNSPMSKEVHSFVEKPVTQDSNLVTTELEVIEPSVEVTVDSTEESLVLSESLTVSENEPQALPDKVESTETTVEETDTKTPFLSGKRIAIAFGVLLFLVWIWQRLKPRPQQPQEQAEVSHG